MTCLEGTTIHINKSVVVLFGVVMIVRALVVVRVVIKAIGAKACYEHTGRRHMLESSATG